MVGRVLAKDELGVRFSLPAQEDRLFIATFVEYVSYI